MSGIEYHKSENKIINENEFIYDGVTYVAQEYDGSCEGCALISPDCVTILTDNNRPACNRFSRLDEREVIFIKKPEQATVKGTTTMIDFTKPVQTRDGKPVRILCTDRAHDMFKVAGLIMMENGMEAYETWTLAGKYSPIPDCEDFDLIQVEEKPTPRRHAELIKRWAEDDKMRIKYRYFGQPMWKEVNTTPGWAPDHEYEEILPGDPLF